MLADVRATNRVTPKSRARIDRDHINSKKPSVACDRRSRIDDTLTIRCRKRLGAAATAGAAVTAVTAGAAASVAAGSTQAAGSAGVIHDASGAGAASSAAPWHAALKLGTPSVPSASD
jgi:hypothetical protein